MPNDIQMIRFHDNKGNEVYRPLTDIREIKKRKDGDFDVLFGRDLRYTEHEILEAKELNDIVPFTMIAVSDPNSAFTPPNDDDEDDEDEE